MELYKTEYIMTIYIKIIYYYKNKQGIFTMIIIEKLINYINSYFHSEDESLKDIRKRALIVIPVALIDLIFIIIISRSPTMSLTPYIIALAATAGITIIVFVDVVKRERKFMEKLPYTITKARVIAKRSNLSGSIGDSFSSAYSNGYGEDCYGSQIFGVSHNNYITDYYVTFEMNDGGRIELKVPEAEFGILLEGDNGVLKYKLNKFDSFDRDRTGEKY